MTVSKFRSVCSLMLCVTLLTILTSEAAAPRRGKLKSINPNNGVLAQFRAPYLEGGKQLPKGQALWQVKTTGKIQSSPALDNQFIYVVSSHGDIYAFNRIRGILQWQQSLAPTAEIPAPTSTTTPPPDASATTTTPTPAVASPLLPEATLPVNPSSLIERSSPALYNGKLYVGTTHGELIALSASTGEILWRFDTGRAIVSSPVVAASKSGGPATVYFASRNGKIYALNPDTGSQQWAYDTGNMIDASPYYAEGKVYTADYNGRCYALNASTGELVWQYTIEGPVVVSPVSLGKFVYFSSTNGALYALDVQTGTKLWTYNGSFGGSLYVPAIVMGDRQYDRIFIADSEGLLVSISSQYGNQLWNKKLSGPILSAPVLLNGTLYIASGDGEVSALSAADGKDLWKVKVNTMIESGLVVNQGVLYFGANNGRLYALQ